MQTVIFTYIGIKPFQGEIFISPKETAFVFVVRKIAPDPRFDRTVSFIRSDRKSKNYATFYFCHLDTDSEQNEEAGIVVEDSSEEEWTYTSSRGNNNVTSEQRKTNVLVRLDFGEGESPEPRPTVDIAKTSEMKPVKETRKDVSEGVDETSNETDASSQREKDSDDETRNDKTRIQRLIKEVEKLVGEERRNGAPRTFSQLILDDKGSSITNNHRAKYARIKEWLKLNNVRGHEGRSTLQVTSFFFSPFFKTFVSPPIEWGAPSSASASRTKRNYSDQRARHSCNEIRRRGRL